MHDKHLYEYAVIRIVPKIEREEFINIGIVLFSKHAHYLKVRYQINEGKLKCLCDQKEELDLDYIHLALDAFQQISKGSAEGGSIAKLDKPERFRWLTSVRSTVIQTSRPHPGFTDDLDETLEYLFNELVL